MISTEQWRACVGLWSILPQHRRKKNLRTYYQCKLKGQMNISFGGVSAGKKFKWAELSATGDKNDYFCEYTVVCVDTISQSACKWEKCICRDQSVLF